jgi:hypothetical protein
MFLHYKLGKTEARPEAVALRFSSYFNKSALPVPPTQFGRPYLLRNPGMLGNDEAGDCVDAALDHASMQLCADAGLPVPNFSRDTAFSDYTAMTGFDPNAPVDSNGDNPTDVGTDLSTAAAYWRKTGMIDADGKRHTVQMYTALRPGDQSQLALSTWLFGVTPIGLRLTDDAEAMFEAKQAWDVRPGQKIEGGHCVPVIARDAGANWWCFTWGRLQLITPAYIDTYMDEGLAILSLERLNKLGLSPQGFDQAALADDFNQVTA